MISSIQIDALQRPCLPLGRTHRGLFAVHKSMCPMLIRATLHYGNWIHGTGLQDQCSVSDTHLLTHQTRWTCFTDNTVGWKRHTDIFYVCNFKSSFLFLFFIVVSALFSKKPFQHLVWDRLSILSIHQCLVTPSSPQNSCVPPLTLSCQAGLGSLARLSLPWKGMARGGGGVGG